MQGIKKPCYLLGIMSVTDASALRQIMDMEEEDEAIREKAQSLIETVIKGVKEQLEALQKKEREADYVIGNIQWIACKDFTVERGRQQIEEYISHFP
ncbi:A-kinase anchor protein 14 isoform D [Alligator mississippiensis]|uniref:A-kinase anchor protein 14 isoform D n=1 Tax=Alligator mississippiensis TaxID=8496 RepID=A0A151NN23_ALLMI|nr:A-kinase anchor protein 14 isoform D [Alligator mississippiensis]